MATQIGVAVVWGIPGSRQAGTGFETVGSRYSNEASTKEIKDQDGETKTWVVWDKKQKLELDVYPSGGSPGTLPDVGDTVAVNGVNYKFEGGEEVSTNEGEQKMVFRLIKWGSNITIS